MCLDASITAAFSVCFCQCTILIPSLFPFCLFCVISLTVSLWIVIRVLHANDLIESDSGLAATVSRAAPPCCYCSGSIFIRPVPRSRFMTIALQRPEGPPSACRVGQGHQRRTPSASVRAGMSRVLFRRVLLPETEFSLTAFPFQGFKHGPPLPPGSTASGERSTVSLTQAPCPRSHFSAASQVPSRSGPQQLDRKGPWCGSPSVCCLDAQMRVVHQVWKVSTLFPQIFFCYFLSFPASYFFCC